MLKTTAVNDAIESVWRNQRYAGMIKPEMLSIHALNFSVLHNSPSRSTMFAGHISSRLVTNHCEEPRTQTGIEHEMGKYTFDVKMPVDGKVIGYVKRYPEGVSNSSMRHNPETYVFYISRETNKLCHFVIPDFKSYHQYFGYKLKKTANVSRISRGANLPKDMVFAHSPSVGENNSFMYGVNLVMASMGLPGVAEDAVIISESAQKKLQFYLYDRRQEEIGEKELPLNLYGDTETYKAFPDIGTCIREDGLLMMKREYSDGVGPANLSIYSLQEPDHVTDKACYVRGGKTIKDGMVVENGRVIDIKVYKNNNVERRLPSPADEQVERYYQECRNFYETIVKLHEGQKAEHKRMYGKALECDYATKRLMVEAFVMTNRPIQGVDKSVKLLHRKTPIDEYRIEFTIEYLITPTVGFKITDKHGTKGIIVEVRPDHLMPVDVNGRRVEVILSHDSVVGRTNLGRLYEHYFASAAEDVTDRIRLMVHGSREPSDFKTGTLPKDKFDEAYGYMLHYFKQFSDRQYEFYASLSDKEKIEALDLVMHRYITNYIPIDNNITLPQAVANVEREIKPTYEPVSFIGKDGRRKKTNRPVRVGTMYFMLLDKIADDWSSASSAKRQQSGVLTSISKSEKFSRPYRQTPTKTISEPDGRIYSGYLDPYALPEMMDMANNPETERLYLKTIMTAEKPSAIYKIIDRDVHPYGSHRPLQLVQHMFNSVGMEIKHEAAPAIVLDPQESERQRQYLLRQHEQAQADERRRVEERNRREELYGIAGPRIIRNREESVRDEKIAVPDMGEQE